MVRVASMLLATATCMPESGTGPSGRSGMARVEAEARGAFLASGALPAAARTSCSVMRPKVPVPVILSSLMLFFFASFLASGVAMMVPAGTLSGRTGPVGFFGASLLAAPLAPLKFSTSEEVMRPPGPDPVTREMSMPFSVAIALASGDATMRSPFAPPPAGAAGAAFAAAAGAAAAGAAAAGAPAAEGATTLSMSALSMTRRATGAPTGATSPSPVMIIARYPSSKASTSISALSDSTTIITSPDEILSPTFLVHCTTLPSFIVDDSAGIRIWMVGGPDATGAAAAAAAGAAAAGAAAPGAVCLPMSAWSETMTATGAPTIADSPSSTRIAER
mmetsp:Transcript_35044/g.81872  ORF Transcript_35044/g.81872 Transcript_35044/m.81872 type:complete len:334 (+) Transcript_35044:700-1701(+)